MHIVVVVCKVYRPIRFCSSTLLRLYLASFFFFFVLFAFFFSPSSFIYAAKILFRETSIRDSLRYFRFIFFTSSDFVMILRYVGFSRSLVKYGLACLGRFAPCLAQRSFLENKATVFLFLSFTCFFVFVFSPFFLFHSVREEFYCCTIFSFFCFISPSHLIFVFFCFFLFFCFIWIRLI